jgi:hypothetical protein
MRDYKTEYLEALERSNALYERLWRAEKQLRKAHGWLIGVALAAIMLFGAYHPHWADSWFATGCQTYPQGCGGY